MSDKAFRLLFIAIASLVLLWPAFYNAYPFVYSDSGTYIVSGYELQVPEDRPIFYGLLAVMSSMHTSLWLAALFQSIIVSWILFDFIRVLSAGMVYQRSIHLASLPVLAACSALPFYTAFLIPDIYTACTAMLLVILLFENKISLPHAAAFIYLGMTHLSNLLSLFIAGMLLLLAAYWLKSQVLPWKRVLQVALLGFSLWLIMPLVNSFFGYGFRSSKASHVFITARLMEMGLVKDFLDTRASPQDFRIYAYKDSLPSTATEFLWSSSSPLYRTGGWQANRDEYNRLIRSIVLDPHYWPRLLELAFTETGRQLLSNCYGIDFPAYGPDMPPSDQVAWRFPHDLHAYTHSRQNTGSIGIDFRQRSLVQDVLICASLLITVIAAAAKRAGSLIPVATAVLLLFMLANDFAAAMFSSVGDRYQSRLSWLLLLPGIILFLEALAHLLNKRKNKQHA